MTLDLFNGVISLIFTFNKIYYYTNTIIITILIQRYVINTESHMRYFLFLFIALVYVGQEYTDRSSHGRLYLFLNKMNECNK